LITIVLNNRIIEYTIVIYMINIQYDTLLYIASFLYSINDYRNLMLVNREIYEYLHTRNYRETRLKRELNKITIKHDAIEDKNETDLYSESSYADGWNHYQCINYECPNRRLQKRIESLAMGIAYAYSITDRQHNDYLVNGEIDFIKTKRPTRRFIPYCLDCMEKYENASIQSNEYYTVSVSSLVFMLALNL